MGNCFSDPSKAESKGQKLGSGPSSTAAPQSTSTSNKPTSKPTAGTRVTSVPPQTLGGGLRAVDNDGDARERALRAAEERAKAAKKKGVNTSNPKAGQLSAKLDADRKASSQPQAPNERMMDQGQWN